MWASGIVVIFGHNFPTFNDGTIITYIQSSKNTMFYVVICVVDFVQSHYSWILHNVKTKITTRNIVFVLRLTWVGFAKMSIISIHTYVVNTYNKNLCLCTQIPTAPEAHSFLLHIALNNYILNYNNKSIIKIIVTRRKIVEVILLNSVD